ncbi:MULTISPECIES: hypothetical protein [Lysinibacillus]|uniref:Uncharacterized protein n=1 Tax=Lysinibacillus antri TaxID=2498145 RepID=A0A432LBS3_9BACI|nr:MULTISPECIES: hypothetical protein [Lysinibacillus]RUL52253.1 hypothetical protein EK386_10400 [Lysinibacillus antri]TSI05167.1 hypothetical protein FJQ64_12715 [Lysinibacillus sp. BW-2-10]
MTELTKNELLLQQQFRESLIIDKYDPQLAGWGTRRFRPDRSESMEDALTWNVFRSLRQIKPSTWIGPLFRKAFHLDLPYSVNDVQVSLWRRVTPPKDIHLPDLYYEIDLIIETKEFVWFLLAKYKSDIQIQPYNQRQSNQILRNIDVGLEYTKHRDFYFSLLFVDTYHTPYGQILTKQYQQSEEAILQDLPHRTTEIARLKGLSTLRWKAVHEVLKDIYLFNKCPFEKFVASQAGYWLYQQIEATETYE